ncbi:MAG: outer membrane protein assembly factor BamD [bacterium]
MKDHSRSSTFLISLAISLLITVGLVACSSTPQKPPALDPAVSLKKAVELIDDKEYEEARQLLNEVKSVDTSRTYAPLAQLKLAESYAQEGDDQIAVTEYRKFLETYPDSQYAPYAQFQIATTYFNQIKGPERGSGSARQALAEYLRLKERYPRNPYKEVVEANIKKSKDIIAAYEFIVGEFYFSKDSFNAALGRFLGVIQNYPDYKALDEVLYYTALAFWDMGDTDSALQYSGKLKEIYPESLFSKKIDTMLVDE